MVGHYSTQQLAYLNLGSTTLFFIFLVGVIGLSMGTLIKTASAYGKEDYIAAGDVLSRGLPYGFIIGCVSLVLCMPANWLLLLTGQTPDMASEGGRVMTVLGYGLVAHILYVQVVFFLEGIERPKVAMYMMLIANVANVFVNYALIYGNWGFPEMGAVGSAWASTIIRIMLAIMILYYLFTSRAFKKYQIKFMDFRTLYVDWQKWRHQRAIGYSAFVGLSAEIGAFAVLGIFTGWIGTLAIASWGIIMNVMTIVFMIAAGMGNAASVRVGIAHGRNDLRDASLAGWTAFLLSGIGLIAASLGLHFYGVEIVGIYTSDSAILKYAPPLITFLGLVMFLDGQQAILANSLRGLGETWVPMSIQVFCYVGIMMPASYYLAFPMGRGVFGLLEAIIIASFFSVVLQGLRFHFVTLGRLKNQ